MYSAVASDSAPPAEPTPAAGATSEQPHVHYRLCPLPQRGGPLGGATQRPGRPESCSGRNPGGGRRIIGRQRRVGRRPGRLRHLTRAESRHRRGAKQRPAGGPGRPAAGAGRRRHPRAGLCPAGGVGLFAGPGAGGGLRATHRGSQRATAGPLAPSAHGPTSRHRKTGAAAHLFRGGDHAASRRDSAAGRSATAPITKTWT